MRTLGKFLKAAGTLATLTTLIACDKSADSFSLLADQAEFQQVASFAPKKIDILWVIDNSGSMKTSQDNLATNFNSFIHRFNQYNYDFNMAVVTTDGWEKKFNSSSTKARFRDGVSTTRSGVYVMNRDTPNLFNVFNTNVKQGISGNGDERAFESFRQSLNDSFNIGKNFRRPDAFLAIIIVSDEDDYSHAGSSMITNSNNSNLYSVNSFVTFLDTYTGRQPNTVANYSVNAITVMDTACKNKLDVDANERVIGTRYMQLADKTGGQKGSLCNDFGNTLSLISDSIIELSSSFQLNRKPVESSIVIIVDGASVPKDGTNGWTYDATTNTITFHGSAVPAASSNIQIYFDPATVKE